MVWQVQDKAFLGECADELKKLGLRFEIIEGDRYSPVAAFQLFAIPLPDCVFPPRSDITICMPRCAGYLPDATILGLHMHECPTIVFRDQASRVPFADPVTDTEWMASQARYYPMYSSTEGLQFLMGTHFLCLHSETAKATSPAGMLALCMTYLSDWERYVFALARHHGVLSRRDKSAVRRQISSDYIQHMVEYVSDSLQTALLDEADRGTEAQFTTSGRLSADLAGSSFKSKAPPAVE